MALSRFSYNGKNVQHVIVSLTVLSSLQMNAEESYCVEQYYAVEVDAVFTVEEKFHYIVELYTKSCHLPVKQAIPKANIKRLWQTLKLCSAENMRGFWVAQDPRVHTLGCYQ